MSTRITPDTRPRIFGAPLRYIQGPGTLRLVGEQARLCGRKALLIADPLVLPLIQHAVQQACAAAQVSLRVLEFSGEITAEEVQRLVQLAGSDRPDVVLAAGGGKGIDAGKGVAKALQAQVITLPTAASNDAPTSKIFVLYDAQHRLVAVEHLDHNPAAVIVDTALIAQAPRQLLLAGIGDTLSKKFEVERCMAAGGANLFGGTGTHAAMALAHLSYELLRAHARPALQAVERATPDAHLESLVEATVLLSGLCFESGGLSIAHALTRGLTSLPGTAQALHGLQVAYGLLVQLTLEQRDPAFMQDLLDYYRQLGLPRNLKALGLSVPVTPQLLLQAATLSMGAPHIQNFARVLSAEDLVQAMQTVEQLAGLEAAASPP